MVSVIGSQHRQVPQLPAQASKPAQTTEPETKGRSSESVGFLAKTQVEETGDTAPNAQGKAAALIAALALGGPAGST